MWCKCLARFNTKFTAPDETFLACVNRVMKLEAVLNPINQSQAYWNELSIESTNVQPEALITHAELVNLRLAMTLGTSNWRCFGHRMIN